MMKIIFISNLPFLYVFGFSFCIDHQIHCVSRRGDSRW